MKRLLHIAAVVALAGCGQNAAPTPVDTGAREAAVAFFTGVTKDDGASAYEMLDPETRGRVSAEEFRHLARNYARKVGYTVDRIHIQACEENGDTATAHVVLIGRSAGHARRFQDAIVLRRRDGRWGAVLPANFGRK